jgi:hypothetical protein
MHMMRPSPSELVAPKFDATAVGLTVDIKYVKVNKNTISAKRMAKIAALSEKPKKWSSRFEVLAPSTDEESEENSSDVEELEGQSSEEDALEVEEIKGAEKSGDLEADEGDYEETEPANSMSSRRLTKLALIAKKPKKWSSRFEALAASTDEESEEESSVEEELGRKQIAGTEMTDKTTLTWEEFES